MLLRFAPVAALFACLSLAPARGVAAQSATSVSVVPRGAVRRPLDVVLYARIIRSADQRALDTTLIATALASPEVEIRRAAARTISQVALRHRHSAVPLLRTLARDADPSVADAAIFGLGLVHDTASIALLTSVARACTMPRTASAAAWSLGEIGRPAADSITALLVAADTEALSSQREVSRELLLATAKLRPLNLAVVLPYLRSHDAALRSAAAYAIARQRASGGLRALLDARSPDAAFNAELARSLTATAVGDSLRDLAIARLGVLVNAAEPHVRVNALHSIGTFGHIAGRAILHGLHDRDANVRVAAAQSSSAAFGKDERAWREAWAADTTFKVRSSLLEASAAAGITLAADATWRESPDWRLRHAAIAAWGGSRDTARARAVALAMVRDPDGRVRASVYGLLAANDTARRDSVVQLALRGARSDPDSIVRNAVAGARAVALDTATVEHPIEWYVDAVRRIVIPSLAGRPPRAAMRTDRGEIHITFDGVLAPLTVLNFATLADRKFYDGLRFHRVVPGFVAQDGDPRGDGEGGPGYAIRDELTLRPYIRGTVGMALSGPDTGGSQYFLTLSPQPHLTGHYTVFGMVTSGLAVMDSLVEGDRIRSVHIEW